MPKGMETEQIELFFPYYVNQERLLDIYAILNGGYSEFSEVTASRSAEKTKKGKADVSFSGFKIFNFGVGTSVAGEIGNSNASNEEAKERKVHTVTSVLSKVKYELANRKMLVDIINSKPGNFVCLPVNLSINSIQLLLNELADIFKLTDEISKLEKKPSTKSSDSKELEKISKAMKRLFDGEEILFQTDSYAIIGNIIESNLYQSVTSDLIRTELKCLAQVKRVFPDGTELMRNTIFSKINEPESKQELIDALKGFTVNNVYDFDAVVVPSIHDKPVYQLEIIALYQ